MLILTLDEIIIDDGKIKTKTNDACAFHQINPQYGEDFLTSDFTDSVIKKSIKQGPILNLPTFKIFKVDTAKNQFRHQMKSSSFDELPMSELISPNSFLKNTLPDKKSISLSEPCLHKLTKINNFLYKSCLELRPEVNPKKPEEPQIKPPPPIVVPKREIQTSVVKTINNKEVKLDRNLRLKIPPKNVNPNRILPTSKLPMTKNKSYSFLIKMKKLNEKIYL